MKTRLEEITEFLYSLLSDMPDSKMAENMDLYIESCNLLERLPNCYLSIKREDLDSLTVSQLKEVIPLKRNNFLINLKTLYNNENES